MKADAASQRREIVGDDRGRTAQGEHHAVGQQFPLGRKFVGQTVEDEVEVQFSGDGDVKAWHVGFGFLLTNKLNKRLARKSDSEQWWTRRDLNSQPLRSKRSALSS